MSDLESAAREAAARLVERGESISVAESSCGGLIAAALLGVPGASAYFLGGTVVYTYAARRTLLGLRREDVAGLEPMSVEVAHVFAARTRSVLSSTWGLAELGIAGPTGSRYGAGPGTCVIAVDGPSPLTRRLETGDADRGRNMAAFARCAVDLLCEALESEA